MAIVRGTNGNDNLVGENVANGGDLMNGFDGDDTLSGLAGNDNIHGDAGADHLLGGEGNDSLDGGLDVGNDGDTIDGGAGVDTVTYAQVQHGLQVNLLLGTGGNVPDHLSGIENVTGTNFGDGLVGDLGANGIQGADGSDFIDGSGGNDNLSGGAGNDIVKGNVGSDVLVGGIGADTLTGDIPGGKEADTFRYFNTGDSGVGLGHRDVVTDFQHGVDKLDLHSVDAKAGTSGDQAFTFVGGAGFSAEGQARAFFEGDHTVVQLNTGGANGAESEIQLAGHVTVSAGDLVPSALPGPGHSRTG